VSQVRTLTPNLTTVTLKMWAQIAEIGNFWSKFAQKWYTPLSDFFYTKFGLGEGVPGLHRHAKFHRCGFKNVGLQPQNCEKL